MNLEAIVQIGDFRIEKRLGAGGMGVVYLARQLSLNRLVALKVLGSALTDQTDIARFKREAQAIARLNHPGIAEVYFIGQDQDICFIAMEYIDGMSVRELMRKLVTSEVQGHPIDDILQATSAGGNAPEVRYDGPTQPYPPEPSANEEPIFPGNTAENVKRLISSPAYIRICCEIVRDAALALGHAHERGVIHRDIKPENILLDREGKPHLIDFGLARFYEDVTLTNTGALVGTPMYMSPEQVTGRIELDHRTDIYSLGLVLYEMLTLSKPISSPAREGILRQIVTKAMVPLRWRNKAVPRELESVVHKATAKDPDERYPSALAFADDLRCVLSKRSIGAKPYRYKLDEREIAAERPTVVVYISLIYMTCSIICIYIIAFHVIRDAAHGFQLFRQLMDWQSYEWTSSRPWLYRALLYYLVLAHTSMASFVSCVYLLSGYKSARFSATILCFLSAFCILYVVQPSLLFLSEDLLLGLHFILSLIPAVLAPLLYRRPIQVWLNFCEQLRLEHKRVAGSAR
jgi:serine/threonine protein kinase